MMITRKLVVLLCMAAVGLAGCPAKRGSMPPTPPPIQLQDQPPVKPSPPVIPPAARPAEEPANPKLPDPDKNPIKTETPQSDTVKPDQVPNQPGNGEGKLQQMESVYFAFGLPTLDASALEALERLYRQMSANGSSYRLEGYCDERGSDDYNLALGNERADAVKNWLQSRGMTAARLSTISYGLDYPADPGRDEKAYARNRRVEIYPSTVPGPDKRQRRGEEPAPPSPN